MLEGWLGDRQLHVIQAWRGSFIWAHARWRGSRAAHASIQTSARRLPAAGALSRPGALPARFFNLHVKPCQHNDSEEVPHFQMQRLQFHDRDLLVCQRLQSGRLCMHARASTRLSCAIACSSVALVACPENNVIFRGPRLGAIVEFLLTFLCA